MAAFVQYKIVVDIYVVGALCVLGIAGNVLSIVVLAVSYTHLTLPTILRV